MEPFEFGVGLGSTLLNLKQSPKQNQGSRGYPRGATRPNTFDFHFPVDGITD